MTEQDQNPLEDIKSQAASYKEIKRNATGAGQSKKRRKTLPVAAAILAGASLGVYLGWDRLCNIWMGKTSRANVAQAQGDVYYCPMHPNFKSAKPGNCPICSMKLVKLGRPGGADDNQAMQAMPGMDLKSKDEKQAAPAANAIFIDPQRQQLIGVRSEPATRQPLVKEIRAVGKVAYDETKVTHIHTKISGYIEQVFVDYVGKVVKAGDPLFTIYSPDLVSTQEEYLLALRAQRQFAASTFEGVAARTNSLLEAARRRLELWDITPAQISDIEKEGKARRDLTIYSPTSGIVTERAAYHHGRFVNPEMDLYTIVDLSTVWINGEVYEYELPFIKTGLNAEFPFPY
ncbi:MAG: efflux RND transporter periplasmic adaptor subunit, partial [Blastocatellia bacterium]|nr:efflux RND transporter periplasmic adaptor subunit [Blastocatellia bacterium]